MRVIVLAVSLTAALFLWMTVGHRLRTPHPTPTAATRPAPTDPRQDVIQTHRFHTPGPARPDGKPVIDTHAWSTLNGSRPDYEARYRQVVDTFGEALLVHVAGAAHKGLPPGESPHLIHLTAVREDQDFRDSRRHGLVTLEFSTGETITFQPELNTTKITSGGVVTPTHTAGHAPAGPRLSQIRGSR
jgi:hypothetical protein